ncbi:hypothetical protein LEP1GSC188_0291 [Leptospira weilii serovar Topaz str. LT2116]|uniref:Uncharacterized protein n=1 Tax=Leptospira weilii serovar Topaz str. LT2116 TaxID=1088540 RepID=M3FJ59_9LEPT|nr:hypothetical protein LEP1GSC188_0291 [Leptospira weilii serovar Topaz str. LT2116]
MPVETPVFLKGIHLNEKPDIEIQRVSDRSGNPATQHVLNAETGIYEKFEMLRCRLKRRARPVAKRRGTPLISEP